MCETSDARYGVNSCGCVSDRSVFTASGRAAGGNLLGLEPQAPAVVNGSEGPWSEGPWSEGPWSGPGVAVTIKPPLSVPRSEENPIMAE